MEFSRREVGGSIGAMRYGLVLIIAALLACGGNDGEEPDRDKEPGEECDSTDECEESLTCDSGHCVKESDFDLGNFERRSARR
jgi:hypothetical protein